MAEDADREHQKLLWDAALESMGCDTVRIRLNNMPADRSAAFKLPGQPSCKRGYTEDWLGRTATAAKATDTKRYRYILIASVVAAVAAVVGIIAV